MGLLQAPAMRLDLGAEFREALHLRGIAFGHGLPLPLRLRKRLRSALRELRSDARGVLQLREEIGPLREQRAACLPRVRATCQQAAKGFAASLISRGE
jgi:hypothetical protein